jgi:2'-5' RNA ligase
MRTAGSFTQKYTIIQLFEDIPEGTQFASDNWPLHATIVDTFAIRWDVRTMIEHLDNTLAKHAGANSKVEGDQFFGSEGQIPVTLIEKMDDLVKLHYDIIELLEKGSLKLNDPHFARDGFLPHATIQKHARLHRDDEVSFDALTIIDMFPDGNPYQRKVLKTISIGEQ